MCGPRGCERERGLVVLAVCVGWGWGCGRESGLVVPAVGAGGVGVGWAGLRSSRGAHLEGQEGGHRQRVPGARVVRAVQQPPARPQRCVRVLGVVCVLCVCHACVVCLSVCVVCVCRVCRVRGVMCVVKVSFARICGALHRRLCACAGGRGPSRYTTKGYVLWIEQKVWKPRLTWPGLEHV